MSAHHNNFDRDGLWTDRTVSYYEARARGGAGLLVAGAARVHPREPEWSVTLRGDWVFAPGQVDWYRAGTKAVKRHGTVMLNQLFHGGRQIWDTMATMEVALAPSAEPCPVRGEVPKAMEQEDIDRLVDDFAAAASLSQDGGFDGVEIHVAFGYLLSEFLTPTANKRTDDYGGDLENRLRFPLRVLYAVREAVGGTSIVGVRLLCDEFVDGGLTVDDAVSTALLLEATGAVDYLSVTQATYQNPLIFDAPMYAPMGWSLPVSAAIKEAVDLPVVGADRIKHPRLAEKAIATGQADVVVMTRATICDPDMPAKARAGAEDEIRYCIGCNQKCLGHLPFDLPITCMYNPASGREFDSFWAQLEPAAPARSVLVIGGGPAGCEAARVLAERGHRVVLHEREATLGGQLSTVERAPGREEWQDVYRYYERQLQRLGVDLRFGTPATTETILAADPEVVVVATGSVSRTRPYAHLPQIENVHEREILDVRDVLCDAGPVADRVVVYAGDKHLQGLTTAEALLDTGRTVTIVCPDEAPGQLVEEHTLAILLARLRSKGLAALRRHSAVTAVELESVTVTDLESETTSNVSCGTLVSSFGGVADDSLYFALKGKVADLYRIGDCVAPRTCDAAVFDGSVVGRRI